MHDYKFLSYTSDIHIHACSNGQLSNRYAEFDIILGTIYKRPAFLDVVTGAAD